MIFYNDECLFINLYFKCFNIISSNFLEKMKITYIFCFFNEILEKDFLKKEIYYFI
jgi:hypothetical protein